MQTLRIKSGSQLKRKPKLTFWEKFLKNMWKLIQGF